MSVFPITWADKQDSPELLAYLAQYGSESYVSATEINKIRDGLNELYNSVGGGTGLINMNGFYPVGQDYIFPAFRVWKINGTVYSNATQISINIPYAATGKHRIDSIAAMPDDTIIRVPGPEVLISNSAAEASIPPGSIRVTAIPVNESGFGIPEPPILINQFVKKNEFAENIIEDSGDITIGLDTESSSFRITGAVTSIIGFEMSDNFLNDNYYPNKIIKLANNSGSDFPISHVGASTYVARFPSETDFIFKNNHVVFFQPVKTDLGLYLEFCGVGRDEVDYSDLSNLPDLSLKADVSYVDSLMVGLWDDRGSYDASSNAYPNTGGSGTAGAILKGDIWTVSVAGILGGSAVEIGDTVRAIVDTPGTTPSNWTIQQNNIGYVPENITNKATTMTGNTTSNVVYLSAKAIYDWCVGKFQDILTDENFGALINALTGKTTPVDADSISIVDSADSNKQKKVSLTNLKAFFKTYFDTLYGSKQALYFYASASTTTFTADQKNMHISRFTSGNINGAFGLTLGTGIPESAGVIDMVYMGDVSIPLIVPFDCKVEEVIIRYARTATEVTNPTNLMFRMMSDASYNVNNQMICDYNVTGTTNIANQEVSVPVTVLSHSTITKGGGLKFAVRTNNATAQGCTFFRIMVIVKKI